MRCSPKRRLESLLSTKQFHDISTRIFLLPSKMDGNQETQKSHRELKQANNHVNRHQIFYFKMSVAKRVEQDRQALNRVRYVSFEGEVPNVGLMSL